MPMNRILCCAVLLAAVAGARAETAAFPVDGGYGFDWTRPKSAKCRLVTPNEVRKFVRCEFSATGAFGLPLAYHTCKVRPRGEVIVLDSEAHCLEALETMRANGD